MNSKAKTEYFPFITEGAEEEYSLLPQKTYNPISELFPFPSFAESDFWNTKRHDHIMSMVEKFQNGTGSCSTVSVPVEGIITLQHTFSFLVVESHLHQQGFLSSSRTQTDLNSTVPTVASVDGRFVLLDGTHRMLTAYIAGETGFTVELLR